MNQWRGLDEPALTFASLDFARRARSLMDAGTELTLSSATVHDTRTFFEFAGFLGTDGEKEKSVLLAAPA